MLMHALAASCEELRARTGNPPTGQIHVYLRKMGTDLILFSSNTLTRDDYLGYKSIKIESILSISNR